MKNLKWIIIANFLFKVNKIMMLAIFIIAIIIACEKAQGESIRVMVIDSGISHHKDLQGFVQYRLKNNKTSYHYLDRQGHGTHIAGTIIYGDRSTDHVGKPVCKNVKIYSCKYFDPDNSVSDRIDKTVRCIRIAAKMKMDIVSYAGGGDVFSIPEYEAVKAYVATGGLFVAAANNYKSELLTRPSYPASYATTKTILGVQYPGLSRVRIITALSRAYVEGSIRINGYNPIKYLPQSNYSEGILTQEALGERILSTLPNNQYGYMSGTSQATAMYINRILKNKCNQINDTRRIK